MVKACVGEAVRSAPVQEVLGADGLDHRLPSGILEAILADSIRRPSSRGRADPRAGSVH